MIQAGLTWEENLSGGLSGSGWLWGIVLVTLVEVKAPPTMGTPAGRPGLFKSRAKLSSSLCEFILFTAVTSYFTFLPWPSRRDGL